MELVWYRLLGPLLGGSVFTFGLVLAVALAGIGVGGLLYSLVGRNRPATLGGFAVCCLAEAVAVAATFALGDRVALLALALLPLGVTGFAAAIAGWTLVTALVVLAPAIIAGYQFPMLIALFGQGRERLGRDVGLAYAANTAGAIVGSLAGGFGVLPWLSAPGRLAAGGDRARRARRRRRGARPSSRNRARSAVDVALTVAAGSLSAAALAVVTAPAAARRLGRRRSGATAASAPAARRATPSRRRTSCAPGATPTRARSSGSATASRAASRSRPKQNGYAFIVNGKSDGSARARRRHAGDARPARRAWPSAADARAGHRPRHRQQRRVARRDPVDGARRRRRARAGRRSTSPERPPRSTTT